MNKFLIWSGAFLAIAFLSARAADAKPIYDKECAKCHGPTGKGDTKMGQKVGAKDYTDPKFQATLKDENMAKIIKEGLKEKGTDKTLMKSFENLSSEEIKALVAYMRGFAKK
jgi:mono/diheme cytochrome c family protein